MEYRVISIGALAAHPLWNEKGQVRSGHATTTLVESDAVKIIVDPSLPGEILSHRLRERRGIGEDEITHVFLTSFRPDVRRGLALFENAAWWIAERERETIGQSLIERYKQAEDEGEEELCEAVKTEIALLKRCEACPDHLAPHVDLFPLYGRTPGSSGLLLSESQRTVLVCGDAVPTIEHLERGQVLPDCADLALAQESFREAVEIADVLVLGRDNVVINPTRRPY